MTATPPRQEAIAASLEKGLMLFHRIARDRGAISLKEIAADLHLPRSTLYRLAGALQDHGLITRSARGSYDIGIPLIEALNGVTLKNQLAQLSRPVLRHLAKECHATAHLGVLENDMVTYLVKESASNAQAAATFARENMQLEAYGSAIGKVLLAWLPAPERSRYLAGGPFVAMTERTLTDPHRLQDSLKAVRSQNFARDDGEIANDLYCLAVPVWTHTAPMTIAISMSFPRRDGERKDDAAYIAKLRSCAAKLCVRFGKNPPEDKLHQT